MAKLDVLDILRVKRCTPYEFDFDSLWIPPIYYFLSQQDVDALRKIATSARLAANIRKKYQMIDEIMRSRGFKKFSAGTNRVVYSCLEDDRFVVKVAVDRVGMQDNPMEYKNQFLLKPFVTKMFYTSPCGTVGFAERVLPIKNKAEFRAIASDVFDIIISKILGEYVVEDIGTEFFMNYGIRMNHGPVLLDYPYVYKLDGKKLFCNKIIDMATMQYCEGEIDYDAGFNHLVCMRCGKTYLATDLRDNSSDNKIIIKGGIEMKITLKEGNKVVHTNIPTDEVIRPIPKRNFKKTRGLTVAINNGDGNLIPVSVEQEKEEPEKKVVEPVKVVTSPNEPITTNSDPIDLVNYHEAIMKEYDNHDDEEEEEKEEAEEPEVEVTPESAVVEEPEQKAEETSTNEVDDFDPMQLQLSSFIGGPEVDIARPTRDKSGKFTSSDGTKAYNKKIRNKKRSEIPAH